MTAVTIVITYSGLTYARSDLWGNPLLLLSVWTENNPGTSRNYIEGHIQSHQRHRPVLAEEFLDRGIKALPDNVFLRIGYTAYRCGNHTLLKTDVDNLKFMLGETQQTKSHYLYQNLNQLLGTSFSAKCEFLTDDDMREIIHTLLINPNILKYDIRLLELLHLLGHLELKAKNYSEAKALARFISKQTTSQWSVQLTKSISSLSSSSSSSSPSLYQCLCIKFKNLITYWAFSGTFMTMFLLMYLIQKV